MSTIGHLLVQPLTITTMSGTTTDSYGNTVPAAGVTTPVLGYLEQLSSDETIVNRDTSVSRWVVYLPATTAVDRLDKVTFQSQVFQVDGVPEFKWNPRVKEIDHIECRLVVSV